MEASQRWRDLSTRAPREAQMKDDIITRISYHFPLHFEKFSVCGPCFPPPRDTLRYPRYPTFHFKESLFIRVSNNVLIHMLHKVREGEAGPCAIIGYPRPPDPEMRNGHNCARTRRKRRRMGSGSGQQK